MTLVPFIVRSMYPIIHCEKDSRRFSLIQIVVIQSWPWWSLKASLLWTVSALMIRMFYWQASAGSLTCWWGLPPRLQGHKIQREGGTVDGGLCFPWVMGKVSAHTLRSSRHRQRCFACLLSFWCPSFYLSVLVGLDFPGMLCFRRFLPSFSALPDRDRNALLPFIPAGVPFLRGLLKAPSGSPGPIPRCSCSFFASYVLLGIFWSSPVCALPVG